MEYDEILKLKEKDGINPVLALAVDDLTENVFIITEDFSHLHVMYNLELMCIHNPKAITNQEL